MRCDKCSKLLKTDEFYFRNFDRIHCSPCHKVYQGEEADVESSTDAYQGKDVGWKVCSQCREIIRPNQRTFGNWGPHSFCSWDCSHTHLDDLKVCAQCHKILKKGQWHFEEEGNILCCLSCSNAYRKKENAMEYRGHTFTVKMYIIPPNGPCKEFDMPASTFKHEAEKEIDELLSVKCLQCGSIIEQDALFVKAASNPSKYCSISCYERGNPAWRLSVRNPKLERLDSAPSKE